jgi:hypothetical protein
MGNSLKFRNLFLSDFVTRDDIGPEEDGGSCLSSQRNEHSNINGDIRELTRASNML